MTGHVDDEMRALLSIRVGRPDGGRTQEVMLWIDTAFNGTIVLPENVIRDLGLEVESTTEAILADGNKIQLETFGCCFDWFGANYRTQIVPSNSEYGLLGTMLLRKHRVEINYNESTVVVD